MYNVGIYTRLSVDDANNSQKKGYIPADESASIENQKLLLSKFVMLNGWIETRVYSDDGYSGGNFQRPGFQRMIADAQAGIINLILVKDLSRLGRDYIEVGRYTDVLFPSWGCRFASLLDDIDTARDDNDMMHFRSLMNDYHLKELSGKIKSVLNSKVRKGEFLSAYAPYGYRKSQDDKHKLVVDEEAAGVVRRIYAIRLTGAGYAKIAGILNSEEIPTPRDHWNGYTGKYRSETPRLWKYATVKDILNNDVFLGIMTQHHTGTMSYKNKKRIDKQESEWVRHENAFEPIIDRDTWDRVQEINCTASERNKNAREPEMTLFSKRLFCLDCGTPMRSVTTVRRNSEGEAVKRLVYYGCGNYYQTGRAICSSHTISEINLKQLVLAELKSYADAIVLNEAAVLESVKRQMSVDDTEQQNHLRREIMGLEQRISELSRITADLYEDKVAGKISETTFIRLMEKNEQERKDKQTRRDEAADKLTAIEEKILSASKWAEAVRRHIHLTDICRADVEELIERIEVGESDRSGCMGKEKRQKVKIFWRFVGCLGG
jgi:DNA invertase Pin-like site-specific DNA recombinase